MLYVPQYTSVLLHMVSVMLLIVSVLLHIASVILHIVSVRLVAHCKCFVAHCKFLLHIVSVLVYCIFQKFPAKPENYQNRYPVRNNKKPMRGKEAVFIFFYNDYICITKGMLKASISVFDSLLFY